MTQETAAPIPFRLRDRTPYLPITGRPVPTFPGGKKLAVWLIVNIEEWTDNERMPRTVLPPPAGGSPSPDVPNWCWHEYGNRVGFWRLLDMIDAHRIPAAIAINGIAVETYTQITQAAIDRSWEFIGHGYNQKNMQNVENEAAAIAHTTEVIERATGTRPRGWLGPGLTETWQTPERLEAHGYDYVCDWVLDDQPVKLAVAGGGHIWSVPYTQECNDVAMFLVQNHPASEYASRAIDQFEQLKLDSRSAPRVMALVVHPYIMGAPHRAKYFKQVLDHIVADDEAVFLTGSAILDGWPQ